VSFAFRRWAPGGRRAIKAEMRDFYGSLPGDLQDQLRQLYEREARTPGTLSCRNQLEGTGPWRVLAALALVTAITVLVIAALGGDLADLGKLFLR
jgi:hypothetical protein